MAKSAKAIKTKIADSKKSNSNKIAKSAKTGARDSKLDKSLQDWHSEIKAMREESFDSLEDAAYAVAERVAKRFKLNAAASKLAIEFIQTTLITDPMAIEYLRKSLKISG